jgi:hypothetical protein
MGMLKESQKRMNLHDTAAAAAAAVHSMVVQGSDMMHHVAVDVRCGC